MLQKTLFGSVCEKSFVPCIPTLQWETWSILTPHGPRSTWKHDRTQDQLSRPPQRVGSKDGSCAQLAAHEYLRGH